MKGYYSRKERIRKPKRTVLIVCEGEKTEITYFNKFKIRNSGVHIDAVHGKCTDPKNIVDFAEERMNNKWSIDFDEGDGVWCVFDVDDNTDHVLKNTFEHAKTKNIQIALSNPCFELWFLLHYKLILSQISRDEALIELKKYIKNYKKNMDVYPILKDKQGDAIQNAKKLNKKHKDQNIDLFNRRSNPATQVFELIEFIQKLIENNKRS